MSLLWRQSTPAHYSCSEFQAAEDRMLALWQTYVTAPWTVDACARLRGWGVFLVDGESFQSFGQDVAGTASCATHSMQIAASTRITSALMHESMHGFSECLDYAHELWPERGQWRAVEAWDTTEAGR
jgi:hypothetical protein